MAYLFCIIAMQLSTQVVKAQRGDWRVQLELLAEEENISVEQLENMYDELTELEANPLNLNSVTREQLERIPLLSHEEAAGLHGFLTANRPVYTIYELRNVPQLDYDKVLLIMPFFYVGESEQDKLSLKDALKYGRSELQVRLDKTLNQRAGYGDFSDSILDRYPNRKYRGEDFYHSLRYSFNYRNRIQWGITAEKDAGEPFMKKGYQRGYDHYGVHLVVRDVGNLKSLAVGDYRLSWGQGLVLNNNFATIKAWAADNIIKYTEEPKRHFSTAEYGFFRGAAATYQLGKMDVTAIYSNKRLDANLNNMGEITSFKVDGYHRTPLEIEKKNNTREQVMGTNVNYRNGYLQIGGSLLYHRYNRWLYPTVRDYNLFYLRDNNNLNVSVDYSYRFRHLRFAGETAADKGGAVATTNMIQYKPNYLFSLSALYRYLPASYNALHAQTFMENSRVQNEQGLFIGTTFKPISKITATAFVDLFKFPWLKSQVNRPSKGMEVYSVVNYALKPWNNVELRYRYKRRELNTKYPDEDSRTVLPHHTHKMRARWSFNTRRNWQWRTTADAALYQPKHLEQEVGWMISQNVGYRGRGRVHGDLFVGYFSADSHAARLYSYERNLLSTFYVPSFYGEGVRGALSLRYNITDKLSFSVKCGYTNYFNRESIGSGTEMIDGNTRTDIFTFLRWKF